MDAPIFTDIPTSPIFDEDKVIICDQGIVKYGTHPLLVNTPILNVRNVIHGYLVLDCSETELSGEYGRAMRFIDSKNVDYKIIGEGVLVCWSDKCTSFFEHTDSEKPVHQFTGKLEAGDKVCIVFAFIKKDGIICPRIYQLVLCDKTGIKC